MASDLRLYAPDGKPWCRFGVGFACLNGDDCKNPNHRRTVGVRETCPTKTVGDAGENPAAPRGVV